MEPAAFFEPHIEPEPPGFTAILAGCPRALALGVSAAAPLNLPAKIPEGIASLPAKTASQRAAKSNTSFQSIIHDELTPPKTAGPRDTPGRRPRGERNRDEQDPGRASIAGMFTIQSPAPPPPVRLPLSMAGGDASKDAADPSGSRTASSAGSQNWSGLDPSLALPASASHPEGLQGVSTSAAAARNLALQAELAFSAVLAPIQKPASQSLTAKSAMGDATALLEEVPAQVGPTDHSRPDGGSAVPGTDEAPADGRTGSNPVSSASAWPGAGPEPETPPGQRTETVPNLGASSTGRRGDRPVSEELDVNSLVKPAGAISAAEDQAGSRPSFQFTPAAVAGNAADKEPTVSPSQPAQAPEPPEQPAPPMQSPAIQNLQIRVGEDPTRLVELQVSEHAGNIHVAVRCADPELTIPLRLNLPGLVENLERRGYRTESLSVNEPGPMNTTHSEPKPQADQNGSWTDSQNGGRGRDDSGRNRRRRTSGGPETEFSLNPLQENNS